jgi:indolepyruvate decarboxylase
LDFCKALFKVELMPKPKPALPEKKDIAKFNAKGDTKLTVNRLFEKINSVLDENTVIIADVGDSLLGASDFTVHHAGTFYAPALYLSMGYAIPAALGIKLAKPDVKPIILVGDGAFQMSCGELGNFVKYNLNAVVVLLNNKGYATERIIVDGAFNDIPDWQYHNFAKTIGCDGYIVTNELDLENILTKALDSKKVSIINCVIDAFDVSPALVRVTESLARKVNKGQS